MKYPKGKTTANAGVIYVHQVVNAQGSVFRPVHQENDFGIDGYIELISSEEASGRLIAVQIKAGDSYLSRDGQHFEVRADNRHIEYWRNFMVPVILVSYSPSKNLAAWVSIRDYLEHEEYQDRVPIRKISVGLSQLFDEKALSESIAGLAHARADERTLIRCADMCLSLDPTVRRQGFQILIQHPDSRRLKVTCFLARRFLLDDDIETAKDALFILGYGVGRKRWSWNPNNKNEAEVISYASQLCSDLQAGEIRRLMELVDDESFAGPDGLGERCFDVLCCCSDRAQVVLEQIAADRTLPIQRRANALYLLFECDDQAIEDSFSELCGNPKLIDVAAWMFKDELGRAFLEDEKK